MSQLALNSDFDTDFVEQVTYFADVVLPIALSEAYTYRIPRAMQDMLQVGSRVIVQFGKKRVITGIVSHLHTQIPKKYTTKYILDCLDVAPVVNDQQFKFFNWMAQYYMCTVGEVFNAALPSGLKLSSESLIQLNPDADQEDIEYSETEQTIIDALQENDRLSFDHVSELLGIKTVYPILKTLLKKKSILLFEQVKDKYKPKIAKTIVLQHKYFADEEEMKCLFFSLEKKEKQLKVLLKYLSLVPLDNGTLDEKEVLESELLEGELSSSSLKTLIKNKVFLASKRIISRLGNATRKLQPEKELSDKQVNSQNQILASFEKNKPVLLHGVTGSGKTEIYIHLIRKAMENSGQAFYLLPEIALTTQIVSRLYKVFGNKMGIYHSKYSDNERVEVWNGVKEGRINLVVGVRSSIFLPFDQLSLIIIDEEHERSFKQHNPAPRYHARDAAIWLAHLHHANILLGTATPSVESYHNAKEGKYELIEMTTRYGEFSLPSFELANVLTSRKEKRMNGDFTPELLKGIKEVLDKKEQIILFQNRRGYAPYLICNSCNYIPKCQNCDVTLTYHMHSNVIVCHYCGHKETVPTVCDACTSTEVKTVGYGTEKIEEDIKLLFPEAHIQRMDQDTTRSKYGYQNIIDRFANGDTDILVGTQMLSKGLDFDHVALVGVFDYDRIVYFPDFRSHERAFQLITQVSGRAGRKSHQGKVIIQTGDPTEALLQKIVTHDYYSFFEAEIKERQSFQYPPYHRMIKIVLKHKDKTVLQMGALHYVRQLHGELGKQQVLGPQPPVISKIRNLFIEEIYIKMDKQKVNINKVKILIYRLGLSLKQSRDYKSLRLFFDVDPN